MSPAPPLPDQQQSLNRNDKLRRLSVAPSIRLILCSLYSSIRATHTHIDNQLAVLCVCASGRRGEEEGNMTVLSCGGGVTFFSPGVFFFFFSQSFRHLQLYLIQPEGAPPPTHHTSHWIQSRGLATTHNLTGYSPEAPPL